MALLVLAGSALFGAHSAGMEWSELRDLAASLLPQSPDAPTSGETPAVADGPPEPAEAAPANPFRADQVNILVCGTDQGSGRTRTDTMLLAVADFRANTLSAVSIPRDTRVSLPGHGVQKINAAYPLGGAQLSAQAAADLLRVPVHHFVRVDLEAFEQIIDSLGGVEVTVEKRMHYVDRAQNLFIDLQPGRQTLDGHRAMQYVRFRNDAHGDLGRIERQQAFLREVAHQLPDPRNLAALPGIVRALGDHVETTLKPMQILWLAQLARRIDASSATIVQVPGEAQTIGGISYFIASSDATRLVPALGRSAATTRARPQVTVYNGSDRLGLEKVVVAKLKAAGCTAVAGRPAMVEQSTRTQVYGIDQPAAASNVARALGVRVSGGTAPADRPSVHAAAAEGETGARVVVVLGADYPR